MCFLCEESVTGEMAFCQDCGSLICFDYTSGDDVVSPAAVTSSGDLVCLSCAADYDREEEERIDEEWGWMPGPWDD